jgi:hypothetical protein
LGFTSRQLLVPVAWNHLVSAWSRAGRVLNRPARRPLQRRQLSGRDVVLGALIDQQVTMNSWYTV